MEPDTFGAIHVVVAEEGLLPTTEGMEGHRNRNRHVDTNHADFNVVRESPRCVPFAGEHRHSVGIVVGVDQVHCFRVVFPTHDRQDWP